MTEGRNNGTTEGQGESSIAPTFSKRGYNEWFMYKEFKLKTTMQIHKLSFKKSKSEINVKCFQNSN